MIEREDVIIDPTDSRVKELIKKKVIFGNTFTDIQGQYTVGTLINVKTKFAHPFINKSTNECYSMIAPLPEPTYRPFKSADEFAPYKDRWVKAKIGGGMERITYYNDNVVEGSGANPVRYEDAFKTVTFEDGTPFGIKE